MTGATGYLVDEWVNGAWKQIASLGSGTTSYSVTGLSAGTTYYFDVAACNAAGTTWANVPERHDQRDGDTVDHPAAATAYTPVSGSLFGANGPSYLDVQQGDLGDCWLLASLAEVAARDPADIRSMFTAAGTTVENGATVSLYNGPLLQQRRGRQVRHRGHGTALRRRLLRSRDQRRPVGGPGREGLRRGQRGRHRHHPVRGQRLLRRPERRRPGLGLAGHHRQVGQRLLHQPHQHRRRLERGRTHRPRLEPRRRQPYRGRLPGDPRLRRGQLQRVEQQSFRAVQPLGASSTVGSTVTYNGNQVYGGAF